MPFTPSHAVVALPFLRTPLVPAAVAVGSMVPDLPLYLPVGPGYWFTHSWLGALLVDLPTSAILVLLWWALLRQAVPQLTPNWLAQRWPREWSSGWRPTPSPIAILLTIASLAMGVATHIVWDDFTHPDRWGSVLFPAFSAWDWAHYLSSIFGLVVIGIWGVR